MPHDLCHQALATLDPRPGSGFPKELLNVLSSIVHNNPVDRNDVLVGVGESGVAGKRANEE